MKTHSIPNPELTHVLTPSELTETRSYEVDLSGVFQGILGRANAFVPSAAGAIFLRDAAADIHDPTIPETLSFPKQEYRSQIPQTPSFHGLYSAIHKRRMLWSGTSILFSFATAKQLCPSKVSLQTSLDWVHIGELLTPSTLGAISHRSIITTKC